MLLCLLRDAAWELEPNAFAELLERPNVCSALECKNRKGPRHESENNPFVMCRACGSKAMHKYCLAPGLSSFYCNDCTVALEEGDSGRESLNSHMNNDGDEDYDVDVCHVSDKEDFEIVKHLTGSMHTQQDTNSDDNEKPIQASSSSRRQRLSSSDLEHSDLQQCPASNFQGQQRNDIQNFTNSDTESSQDFLIAKNKRKRKLFSIPSQSDDENRSATVKKIHFDSKNTTASDDSENDDDPLENFYEILQKQQNKPCTSSRTHKTSQCEENLKDKGNKEEHKNHRLKRNTREDKTLDISCIAKRTRRRKTIDSQQLTQMKNFNENSQNRLNTSCIAVRVRTRRRTICAQTAQEHFKQQAYERSRIYEKLQESEDDNEITTTDDASLSDAESTATTTTETSDLNDFIVDDGYEEKDSKFEISCIANRTRKRKSLRAIKTPTTILEETENDDENQISSSTSATSSSAQSRTNIKTYRKFRKQRIISTSSEDSNSEHLSANKTSLRPQRKFLDKMPPIKLEHYLTPKYDVAFKNHHSHDNRTRKRL